MRGDRLGARLAGVRRRLKVRLYDEVGDLLRGDLGPDGADHASDLLMRLSELELEDGDGGLERLLSGLPEGAACQIRQELRRLLDEEVSAGTPGA